MEEAVLPGEEARAHFSMQVGCEHANLLQDSQPAGLECRLKISMWVGRVSNTKSFAGVYPFKGVAFNNEEEVDMDQRTSFCMQKTPH